jgi:hypothetical protein
MEELTVRRARILGLASLAALAVLALLSTAAFADWLPSH